jgi:hypothetical protein
MRIVHVAVDATYQRMLGDAGYATCLADAADEILARNMGASVWDEVLASEPEPA